MNFTDTQIFNLRNKLNSFVRKLIKIKKITIFNAVLGKMLQVLLLTSNPQENPLRGVFL